MQVEEIFPDIEFPVDEVNFFNRSVTQLCLAKGDYFTTPNVVCNRIAFVDSGVLQEALTDGDKEYVIALHIKNQFATSFRSFLNYENSNLTIQALEVTRLTLISNQLMHELCQRHVCWTRFWLKVLVSKTNDLIDREIQVLGA